MYLCILREKNKVQITGREKMGGFFFFKSGGNIWRMRISYACEQIVSIGFVCDY